jgi:hypothetical protein
MESAEKESIGASYVHICFREVLQGVRLRDLIPVCSPQAVGVCDITFPCADAANVALTLSRTA